jgi:hypothetical protein
MVDAVDRLHLSLDSRLTPEATAALIVEAIGSRLLPGQAAMLMQAAASPAARYSSMGDDFRRPDPLTHKARMLLTLLGTIDRAGEQRIAELAGDPWQMLGQLEIAGMFYGWNTGDDFRSRRNRQQRGAVPVGRRGYNRLVRQSIRTRAAALRMSRQVLLRQLTLVACAGLAPTITAGEMHADPDAAAFVAYWTAMRKRRRQFSVDAADNPFDRIAGMLLAHCETRPSTDWWMIARAYPQPQVIARLDEGRRGQLLGLYSSYMGAAARLLKELHEAWPTRQIEPTLPDDVWAARPGLLPSPQARGARTVPVVSLDTMVAAKGVDSSTWNTVAGAYNTARDGWINTLAASGSLGLLEVACPGKAMRLMAGDLQTYHRAVTGSAAHPQTAVWSLLPLPWAVLTGEQECTAGLVEAVCAKAGVDPHATGWTAPRVTGGRVAEFKPTPELVHGIAVRDPLWAGLLRAAGLWSGKNTDDDAAGLLREYRKGEVRA